ncbi:MAG: CDP-6-deoxy-delta-3,4-glucoseen reductase [Burkholderiales bacterium]|nr:CDP-6-deoxy-delta-3,4-glucoseen reductase [Burkholderiales bacterium]
MSHQVSVQPSGHQFACKEGETILQAALNNGIGLPYGCRNGACGSCKGRVVAGTVDYGRYAASALSDDEKARGMALFCCAQPRSDVVIEAREVGSIKDLQVRILPSRVQKIERVAEDVVVISLKLPANERLQYLAGQYIEFLLKDGKRRSYSMANAPHDDAFVQLHVRHMPGGLFTDHVFGKMKERDILRFEGPLGSFFLREDSDKPIIFVASGTGFAPIKAIIEHALYRGIERPMTLYWGGRRPHDLYLAELCRRWADTVRGFRFVPVISDALPEDAWSGRTGFVHRAAMEDFPDMSGHQVYACGAPVVVDAARRDFVAACHLAPEEFHADSFVSEADLARAAA